MARVASFDSAMLELYQAVGTTKKALSFTFDNLKEARYFVQRMHKLRVAMRKENHWLTATAEMVTISINAVTNVVTVKAVDSSFSVKIQTALQELSHETNSLPSPPGRSLQDQITEMPLPLPGRVASGEAPVPREKTAEEISKSEDALAKFLGKGGKRR